MIDKDGFDYLKFKQAGMSSKEQKHSKVDSANAAH